jgi:hypothetical protein
VLKLKGKNKQLYLCLLLAMLLGSFVLICTSNIKICSGNTNINDTNFSIMQISDTQFLSAYYPALFNNLTTWIAKNSENYNLQMVIQTGDNIDNPYQAYQWENANNSMSILLNSGIPYCWDAGNHDQSSINVGNGAPNLGWNGNQYLALNGTFMRSKSFWVDDIFSSKNTAVKFSVGANPFLIINLEYHANSSAIAWMKDLLNKSLKSNVIVATHIYLNSSCGYGFFADTAWENNLRNILDDYPNVFLTLNGHDNDQIASSNQRIGGREEIYFNRQSLNNLMGAASVRIYSFDLNMKQVDVSTYALDTQTWLTNPGNKFSFSLNLQNSDTNNIFPYSYYWVGPSYQSYISFSMNCYAASTTPVTSGWSFRNLSLNGVNSNATITTTGASIVISNYDQNSWINYTVIGNGTQTLTVKKLLTWASVAGKIATNICSNSNGIITISNASSKVALAFAKVEPGPPSASSFTISSTVAGSMSIFSTLWSDDKSLDNGGYIFSTNNTGQWLNASWTPFISNPDWGEAALKLNDTVGTVVAFQEYANNSINLWGDSGIYAIAITPKSDNIPPQTTSPTNFIGDTLTVTPTSTLTSSPNQPNPLQPQAMLITVLVITGLVVSLAFALQKRLHTT